MVVHGNWTLRLGLGVASRGRRNRSDFERAGSRRYDRASARKAGAVASGQAVSSSRCRDRRLANSARGERSGGTPRVAIEASLKTHTLPKPNHTRGPRRRQALSADDGRAKQNRVAPSTQRTTLSGGSLGSHVDEERSQLRYAM